MSPLSDLRAGEWYLIISCEKCKTRHPLFRDLSKGESKIKATYKWSCPTCGHESAYDSDDIERYQHLVANGRANL
jgi:uncharacterized Zn finger protein (UPF0148 family)